MDTHFALPKLGWRVGLDAIIGLIPGLGTAVTTAASTYLLVEAQRARVPWTIMGRMIGNIGVDAVLSAIPVIGSVADLFFKANTRNASLLLRHLAGRSMVEGRRVPVVAGYSLTA